MDIFSDCFSFNLVDKKGKDNIRAQELDNLVLSNSIPLSALVVTDASIKDNIAISIAHVHQANSPLIKTVHHTVFVTSSEAELFVMRCGINQACNKDNISKIVIITDSIHSAKHIFDSSLHPLQSHSAAILSKLRLFFNKNQNNSIEFWECPSRLKWRFHKDVDKDSKSFKSTPIFPCKTSWDFRKKNNSDDIVKQWKMHFQASDSKGNNFLDLLDNNYNIIEPSYIKGGLCSKLSGIPILCVPELLEPLPIMCQLGSIVLGSSQTKISVVHATNTLLKLEGIYSMNAEDSMGTGTLGEIR